jgi:hypothetical protein
MSNSDKQTTVEWDCRGCGVRTWTTLAGGALDCTCRPHDTSKVDVYRILGGKRELWGTAAELSMPTRLGGSA